MEEPCVVTLPLELQPVPGFTALVGCALSRWKTWIMGTSCCQYSVCALLFGGFLPVPWCPELRHGLSEPRTVSVPFPSKRSDRPCAARVKPV